MLYQPAFVASALAVALLVAVGFEVRRSAPGVGFDLRTSGSRMVVFGRDHGRWVRRVVRPCYLLCRNENDRRYRGGRGVGRGLIEE